jgi:O-antigen ligase
MFSFCFLLFLYRAGGGEIPQWQHILHRVGVFSALACGLMPLLRGLMVALAVVALVDLGYQRLFRRRLAVISVLALALVVVPVIKIFDPASYEERVSLVNLFLRVAQQQQTLAVFFSHPLTGVGFASYADAAASLPADLGSFEGIGAADTPHNVLGSVLTETGVLGLIPFVASQIFLVMAFLRLRRLKPPRGAIVWPFFLSIFIIYWVMGMDSTTFQYSDLNLSFIFTVACLYKYGITESPTAQALALRETGAA